MTQCATTRMKSYGSKMGTDDSLKRFLEICSGKGLTCLSLFYSYFDGANASGKPIVATIGALLLFGYTLDYQQHLKHHKNFEH